MIVLQDTFNTKLPDRTYVVLGSFDGLHIGHMGLINAALQLSEKNNCKSMIYTFKNHPLTVVNPKLAPKLIMDNSTKLKLLESKNIDIVNLVPFDEKLMKIRPEEFISKLINSYNVKGIIVGFNYKFGYKNHGDVDLLKYMSRTLQFELHIVKAINFEGVPVSSSRIRTLILKGAISKANAMLFQPFCLTGIVTTGKQLGRTLGFPTANLSFCTNHILPPVGVYYTIVEYNSVRYKGITGIGFSPTVNGRHLTLETYILDFNKEIYNENLSVYFIDRIRDEFKFNSLDELSAQLKKDKEYAENRDLEQF